MHFTATRSVLFQGSAMMCVRTTCASRNCRAIPRPWTLVLGLRPMAAFAIEALKGTAASQLPTDRSSLLARLDNVGLRFAAVVDFELNGNVIPFTRRPPSASLPAC